LVLGYELRWSVPEVVLKALLEDVLLLLALKLALTVLVDYGGSTTASRSTRITKGFHAVPKTQTLGYTGKATLHKHGQKGWRAKFALGYKDKISCPGVFVEAVNYPGNDARLVFLVPSDIFNHVAALESYHLL